MEHHKADVWPATGLGVSGDDDTARFLRELRQLRDGAGLGHAQLAARAHYPYDSIMAAELGPSLPDLPVLSAFVRGCGGPTQEWEERWRSLTSSPSLPVPETRQTGQSDAANAGARVCSAALAGDVPDPSVILAALNRVAEEMASPAADPVPLPPAAQPVAQPVPDLAPSAFSSPSSSFSDFSQDFSTGEAEAVARPAGWDPIRVSSAWPALKHTPTMAEPASDAGGPGGAGSPGGAGAPWGTAVAPWAEDPADAAAATSTSAADSTVAGTGTASTRATGGTSAAIAGAGAASRGGPGRSWLIAIVLVGLVLLCGAVALLVTVG